MKKHHKCKTIKLGPKTVAAIQKQRAWPTANWYPNAKPVVLHGDPRLRRAKRKSAKAVRKQINSRVEAGIRRNAMVSADDLAMLAQGLTPEFIAGPQQSLDEFLIGRLARADIGITIHLSPQGLKLVDALVASGLHGRTPADCCERMVCSALREINPYRPK